MHRQFFTDAAIDDDDNGSDNSDEFDLIPIETTPSMQETRTPTYGGLALSRSGSSLFAAATGSGSGGSGGGVEQDHDHYSGQSHEQIWATIVGHVKTMAAMNHSEMIDYLLHTLEMRDETGEYRLPQNGCEITYRMMSIFITPALMAAHQLCHDPMTGETVFTAEYAETLSRLNSIYNMLYFMHMFTYPGPHIAHNILQVLYDMAPITTSTFDSDESKLMAWCLAIARRENLRHHNGCIYKQRFLHRGYVATHYWERQDTISAYFQSKVNGTMHRQIMDIFARRSDVIFDKLAKPLATNQVELPEMSPDRRYVSTEDGIYDIYTDQFYRYGAEVREMPLENGKTEVVSSVFIRGSMGPWYVAPKLGFEIPEEVFRATKLEVQAKVVKIPLPLFREEIPTPLFDSLMNTQQWSDEMQFWFMYLYGRLMHPINTHDKCQVATLLYGIARSGKSVFLEICRSFFPPERIGQLESHGEKTFGQSYVKDKWLWQCAELEADTNIDPGFLKKLIEGALISGAKKHKDPIDFYPEGHGIVATNTDIAVSGVFGGASQGAIARRFVTFPFYYLPKDINSNLLGKIHETGELIRIFRKCNIIYLIGNEYLERLFGGDIWAALPQSIVEQNEHMMIYSTAVYEFIMNDPSIMLGPECMVKMSLLRQQFDEWQTHNSGGGSGGGGGSRRGGGGGGNSRVKWTEQLYQAVFQRLRISVKQAFYYENSPHMIRNTGEDAVMTFNYRHLDHVVAAIEQNHDVFIDPKIDNQPQKFEFFVFGIGIGERNSKRIIPSFVQRMMEPGELGNEDDVLEVDRLEGYVLYYKTKYYRNETDYVWDLDYMFDCLANDGFYIDRRQGTVNARVKKIF